MERISLHGQRGTKMKNCEDIENIGIFGDSFPNLFEPHKSDNNVANTRSIESFESRIFKQKSKKVENE